MDGKMTVTTGMQVRCNRCGAQGTWPKDEAEAIRENDKTFRIQTMATLECGHCDAHWVWVADLPQAASEFPRGEFADQGREPTQFEQFEWAMEQWQRENDRDGDPDEAQAQK